MDLLIWCVWCSDRKLKVDAETAEGAGIASLICPRYGKVTDVSKQSDGALWVRRQSVEDSEHREE